MSKPQVEHLIDLPRDEAVRIAHGVDGGSIDRVFESYLEASARLDRISIATPIGRDAYNQSLRYVEGMAVILAGLGFTDEQLGVRA